jgi:hypothetical protein
MVRFGDPTIEQSSHQSVSQQPVLGEKTAEMIKELLWPEVNPCPLGRILRENMFHDI